MQTRNLIGREWVTSADASELSVFDPATGETLGSVPRCGADETLRAIDAAAAAFPAWSATTAAERAAPLHRLAALMLERQDDLARILTREQGKPLAEARGEISYGASFLSWAAEEGKRVLGEIIPASYANKRILVLRQPVGVTAAITPWNFPAAMITRKLGPALAAGCTTVIKPSELTPLTALALGELVLEAGIPAGVVNILTGDPAAIGGALLGDDRVRKLSFTGSTGVGRLLMKQASQNLTRLSLELGGHAPFLVFDDADIEAAVDGAMATKYRNMGQTCVCANRFYIQDGVYDAFAAGLQQRVEALRMGHGLENGVTMGPLIDERAVDKVSSHVEDALSKGARLRTGGKRARPRADLTDHFFEATILDDFSPDMLLAHEETFGPVSPLCRFTHEEEALTAANDSEFGLAAYFYTRDASRLMRVAEQLEYGIVGANDGAPSTAQAPFGGVKHSGFGREGGHHVMHEYLDVKYVSWGL